MPNPQPPTPPQPITTQQPTNKPITPQAPSQIPSPPAAPPQIPTQPTTPTKTPTAQPQSAQSATQKAASKPTIQQPNNPPATPQQSGANKSKIKNLLKILGPPVIILAIIMVGLFIAKSMLANGKAINTKQIENYFKEEIRIEK